ncbi:uncharacterized protein PFL1_05691 [Pseudozyma flocculosa PF-1]|uniref:Related to transport protein USO1 n=2 Tax=Pseudozyma flocculosa TaxID=84751 RepID=A0A5C3FBE4_9BASI|nr:uncharacterized protein PFL1_05691 [Pseudozyma flocculosa PF-1]EPQ26712.1 hypothetical protein PFL1_05691 [Pseudozyma flocculosa PF-1]SPO40967.1 related to transport protein USO1 [Pseudozyma flocculosa]
MLHGFDFLRQQYSQLAKPGSGQQTVAATVQTLADRLTKAEETQSPLEDRRAAVLALKGLSRDHTRLVGEKGLPALLVSLERDAKDEELARALIECCITLCEVPPAGSEPQRRPGAKRKQYEAGPPAGLLNTDIFLSEPGPLHALLPLLAPNRAFYTRFASLQLLGSLLRNRPSRVQDHVLVAPGGCGAVLECLAEGAGSSAEIVRNEALLLLPHLVHGNADIQKLVAFEGVFEKLLDVCAVEGRIEGGVIVQDALEGLEALLRYNVSNQNYFRETLSIPMLAPLLFYPPPPSQDGGAFAEQEHARQLEAFSFQEWDQQKLLNARLVVGIVGMLVGGQGEGRKSNQAALLQCGVTKCLAELALASTAPASLKAQSLHVLASLLRASRVNQDQLSTLHVFPIQMILEEADGAGVAAGDAHDQPGGSASASGRPSGDYAQQQQQQQMAEPSYTRLPARPAVAALIGTAVNGAGTKGGLGLRAAALACFEAYVADNLDARLGILSTMASPPDDNPNQQNDADRPYSAGSVLVEGLVQNPATEAAARGSDAYKYLISSMLFSHVVRGSETAKKVARQIAVTPEGQVIKRLRKEDEDGGGGDDDDEDDDQASLIQVVVGNLTMAERELADAVRRERAGTLASTSSNGFSAADWTRIMTGYLVVLSVWLFESPLSVRDFLSESATLQALIQPVAQSSGVDPLVQALAAFLLGVAYEFDTNPGNVAVTRATMQPILLSRIGADNFAVRLERLKDDARFADVSPDGLEKLARLEEEREFNEFRAREREEARLAAAAAASAAAVGAEGAAQGAGQETGDASARAGDKKRSGDDDEDEEAARDRELELSGMGHLSRRRKMGLWFDWAFVEFWRANSVMIQKTILVDPASSSTQQASATTELLDAQRQLDSARDTIGKQGRELEVLEKRVEELSRLLDEERKAAAERIEQLESESAQSVPRMQQLQDEVTAIRTEVESITAAKAEVEEEVKKVKAELESARAEIEAKVSHFQQEIASASAKDAQRGDEAAAAAVAEAKAASEAEVAEWRKKHDELVEQLRQVEAASQAREEERARSLEAKTREHDEVVERLQRLEASAKAEKEEQERVLHAKTEEVDSLTAQLSTVTQERSEIQVRVEEQASRIESLSSDLKTKQDEVESLKSSAAAAAAAAGSGSGDKKSKGATAQGKKEDEEMKRLRAEKEDLTKENEDLLVLLEELSSKRKKDKARMREKGLEVSEDEDDDDDDDDDDADEGDDE